MAILLLYIKIMYNCITPEKLVRMPKGYNMCACPKRLKPETQRCPLAQALQVLVAIPRVDERAVSRHEAIRLSVQQLRASSGPFCSLPAQTCPLTLHLVYHPAWRWRVNRAISKAAHKVRPSCGNRNRNYQRTQTACEECRLWGGLH